MPDTKIARSLAPNDSLGKLGFSALLVLSHSLLGACRSAESLPPSRNPDLDCQSGHASATDDSGRHVQVPKSTARATVLDFWARWCRSCQNKLPKMLARRKTLEQQGIDLVLVGVVEPWGSVDENRSVLEAWGASSSFLVDWNGALARRFGIRALPAAVVLDRKGAIRWVSPTGQFHPDTVVAAAELAATSACGE